MQTSIFRLVFLIACLIYIWLQSLFVQTSHTVVGERQIFAYGWSGIMFGFGFNLIPIGAAWFLWRVKKDGIGAGIFLLCIPLNGVFAMPQLFMERVEVTPTHLSHRREPPHTRFNADIAFDEIIAVTELDYESGLKGYVMTIKDGQILELPANTVITAAHETIAIQLRNRNISVTTRTVRRPSQSGL